MMIDTLKLSKRLQAAGMDEKKADGVADALREAFETKTPITKTPEPRRWWQFWH